MTQLAQCLSLYLTYTLAGDVEHLSDLLERSRSAVVKTETELEHLLLSRGKRMQHLVELLAQQRIRCCLCGCG